MLVTIIVSWSYKSSIGYHGNPYNDTSFSAELNYNDTSIRSIRQAVIERVWTRVISYDFISRFLKFIRKIIDQCKKKKKKMCHTLMLSA